MQDMVIEQMNILELDMVIHGMAREWFLGCDDELAENVS